ncbi:MAG: transketolase [Rhodospirillales bacterium]|nr:transketolase [Rhodospirillales bacterium]
MYKQNWPRNTNQDERLKKLTDKAQDIRERVLETCIKAKTGHLTSSFSCIDMLVSLYFGGVMRIDPENPDWDERDYFILSKGQASPALYTILADLGFYPMAELEKFAQEDGIFGVHLQHSVPGVEITAGSLGLGYGVVAGLALGARMRLENRITVAMLGDGECYEGSIWETAAFVAHQRLNNLITIVDRNYMCATDFTENLIALEPLEEKWSSFGFDVRRIDGHDMAQIDETFSHFRGRHGSKPLLIIADTVKGQGIPSLSNQPYWHGLAPTGDYATLARAELKESFENE